MLLLCSLWVELGWSLLYVFESVLFYSQIHVPIYAAYLYDAVYTYVQALDKVLRNGDDPRNGTDVISYIRNTTFTSKGHVHQQSTVLNKK